MIGPLLRSGTLTDYHPLGAVGHPVYLAAAQLRAALARRLGPDLADSFAIPQRNEDGDTLDWYAPRPGPVVPWSAASPEERLSARSQLLESRARINELARTMQADPHPERQVFARLLAHIFNFPDEDHVYLVDGRPVVSFWGFVRDREAVGSDPLVNLGRFAAPPTEWSLDLADEPRQDPSPNPEPVTRRALPWWIWLPLLLLALVLLLLLLLRGCVPDSAAPFAEWVPDWVAEEIAPIVSEPSAEDKLLVDPSLRDESVPRDVTIEPGQLRDRTLIERGLQSDRTTDISSSSVTDEDIAVDETRVSGSESTSVTDETESLADGTSVLDDTVGTDVGEGDEGQPPAIDEELDPSASETGPIDGEFAGADAELPLTDTPPIDPSVEAPLPTDPAAVDTDAETGIVDPAAEPALSDPTSADGGVAPEEEQAAAEGTAETPPGPDTSDAVSPEEGSEPPRGEGDAIPAVPGLPGSTLGEAEGAPGTAPARGGAAGPSTAPGASTSGPTPQALGGLTSGWRTATSLQDPKTGLPIQMEYRTQEGQGQLRLKRHDGSICRSDASASVKGERLVIDSSGDIRCADGTNFGRPSVECAPGKDGKPECVGRYPGGGTFSLDVQGAASE